MEIIDISSWIKTRYLRLSREVRIAFFSALIIAVITHLTILTNKLINHDSVGYLYGSGIRLDQGRWFYFFLNKVRGGFFVNGIINPLAIILLSITASLTIHVLQIKNWLNIVLVSGLLVTFPSTVGIFVYGGADKFFFALLLATLAVYFATKEKSWAWVVSIVSLTLSLGTYQAYIGYSLGLFIILCFVKAIKNEVRSREILLEGLRYLLIIIISIALYYGILQLSLKATGTTLTAYRDIDNMQSPSLASIPELIYQAYKKVYRFFYYDKYGITTPFFIWAYRISIFLIVLFSILIGLFTKLYRKLNLILAFFLAILFPLGVHIIAVLGQNPDTHWLMIYPFVLVYILLVKLTEILNDISEDKKQKSLELTDKKTNKINIFKNNSLSVLNWTAVIFTVVLIFNWFKLANLGYFHMQLSYESSYATAVRITHDISKMEGYTTDTRVAIITEPVPFITTRPEFTALNKISGIEGDDIYMNRLDYYQMFNNFLSFRVIGPKTSDLNIIKSSEEFLNMPIYPNDGYIQMINGIIVIKVP